MEKQHFDMSFLDYTRMVEYWSKQVNFEENFDILVSHFDLGVPENRTFIYSTETADSG
jgi:hypothetical protein